MSYIIPNDSGHVALLGIDKKIQNIQAIMKTYITWLDYSFGLVDRIVEKIEGGNIVFPAVFVSNVYDPISMLPSDKYSAFSFWVKKPDAEVIDEGTYPVRNAALKYNVSCIFYMNLPKVHIADTWKESKSKARQDTLNFFTKNVIGLGLILKLVSIVDDDITEVYEGFTMEQIDNRFMMMPNYAIRYNFELSFYPECP